MATKSSNQIVDTMGEWFAKTPALPKEGRDFIVKVTPWIALIFGILGILAALAGFGLLAGLTAMLGPFMMLGGGMHEFSSLGLGTISALLGLVASALLLAAYPGTKAKKIGGWTLLFWSEMVSLVASILVFNIVGGIVWAAIGFYLLFQIKSYYK